MHLASLARYDRPDQAQAGFGTAHAKAAKAVAGLAPVHPARRRSQEHYPLTLSDKRTIKVPTAAMVRDPNASGLLRR